MSAPPARRAAHPGVGPGDAAGRVLWRGRCAGPDDTRAVGTALARVVRAGDVVVLTGPLGAGKTTLVQGLARGLGITAPATSPTFVLAREMRGGRLPLIHVDAYRLGSAVELDDLDLDTDLSEAVVAVEWGEGVAERLSPERLVVRLDRAAGDESRTVEVRGVGSGWADVTVAAPGTSYRDHGQIAAAPGVSRHLAHDHIEGGIGATPRGPGPGPGR